MSAQNFNKTGVIEFDPATVTLPSFRDEFLKARRERLEKNFRYVLPAQKSDKIAAKYPKVAYTVGYRLPESVTTDLKNAADPKCYKCLGTGIKDWRQHGTVARVCVCAQSFVAPEKV